MCVCPVCVQPNRDFIKETLHNSSYFPNTNRPGLIKRTSVSIFSRGPRGHHHLFEVIRCLL